MKACSDCIQMKEDGSFEIWASLCKPCREKRTKNYLSNKEKDGCPTPKSVTPASTDNNFFCCEWE